MEKGLPTSMVVRARRVQKLMDERGSLLRQMLRTSGEELERKGMQFARLTKDIERTWNAKVQA